MRSPDPRTATEPSGFNPLLIVIPFVLVILLGLAGALWKSSTGRENSAEAAANPKPTLPAAQPPDSPAAPSVFEERSTSGENAPPVNSMPTRDPSLAELLPELDSFSFRDWNKMRTEEKLGYCGQVVEALGPRTPLLPLELAMHAQTLEERDESLASFLEIVAIVAWHLPHAEYKLEHSTETAPFVIGGRRRIVIDWESSETVLASIRDTLTGGIVKPNVIQLSKAGECMAYLDEGAYHLDVTIHSPARIRIWLSQDHKEMSNPHD